MPTLRFVVFLILISQVSFAQDKDVNKETRRITHKMTFYETEYLETHGVKNRELLQQRLFEADDALGIDKKHDPVGSISMQYYAKQDDVYFGVSWSCSGEDEEKNKACGKAYALLQSKLWQ